MRSSKNHWRVLYAPSRHIALAQAHVVHPLPPWQGLYYLAMEVEVPSPGKDVYPHPIHQASLEQKTKSVLLQLSVYKK